MGRSSQSVRTGSKYRLSGAKPLFWLDMRNPAKVLAPKPSRALRRGISCMSASDPPQRTVRPRSEWTRARRIVVKIGSSLLVDRARGELKSAWLATLADDVAALIKTDRQVILVSSGAIALGRHVLGFARGTL